MFAALDFLNDLTLFHYIAIGGGVVLLLALLLYLIPGAAREKLHVPAIVFGVIGGLAVGVACGAIGTSYYYKKQIDDEQKKLDQPTKKGSDQAKGGPGDRSRGGEGRGPMPMPMFPNMGGGQKQELVSLVSKLDLLTGDKPLTIKLSDEQKKTILEQLKDLDQEKLTNEEATKKLDALKETLKAEKDILEAVGFRFRSGNQGRGGMGGMGGMGVQQDPNANPFRADVLEIAGFQLPIPSKNAKAIKELKSRLEKKG